MNDLSQDEIDALISGALSKEEGEAPVEEPKEEEKKSSSSKKVKKLNSSKKKEEYLLPYDFRKPSPIPEEQKRTITLLHETFAQKLKVSLSSFLRAEVDVTLKNVEQLSYAQYAASLNTPTCVSTFEMPPLTGFGLIEVNAIVAYAIIDKMLGGDGMVPSQVRPFTGVELSIVSKMIEMLLATLSEIWKPIINMSFLSKDLQANPAMIRIIPMKEISLIITLNVKVCEVSGLITLCIPYTNLEPIAFKLGNQQWHKFSVTQSEEIQEAHRRNFHSMELDIHAILGSINLSMEEILSLEKGDILNLDQKTSEPLSLRVSDKDKFLIRPGLRGKHKAIIIEKEIKKE
jgi:flagellar motor switch protein FliM